MFGLVLKALEPNTKKPVAVKVVDTSKMKVSCEARQPSNK